MHSLINLLIQLQELILVRAEQDTFKYQKHLVELNASIESLLKDLPSETRTLFEKIQKKSILAIVPIVNNICSGCGLALPLSLVYAVRGGKRLYQCTHCARILYYPETVSYSAKRKTIVRAAPLQAGIARFSSRSLMMPNLKAINKEEIISILAHQLEKEKFIEDGAILLEETLKRETILNTAVEHGIACPHVRNLEGGALTLALGTSKKGVSFDPSTHTLTHIVFLIVIPTAASMFYLKLLAGLAETFSNKTDRDNLLSAQTPEELWKALIKATHSTIK